MTPEVTIGIPVWQAEKFLIDTLNSARAQTFKNIRILLSIDLSTDNTRKLCQETAQVDDRIEILTHETQLGWIGNMNAVLDNIRTPYFVILPHDDLLDEKYIETLLPALQKDSSVVTTYCDIKLDGGSNSVYSLDIHGESAYERVASFIQGTPNGIPLRGLTRSDVVTKGLRFRDNQFTGFLAGTVYVMELLMQGNVYRVPEVIYKKWVRPDSVHESIWKSWPRDKQLTAWAEHLIACIQAIKESEFSLSDQYRLISACLNRLQTSFLMGGQLYDSKSDNESDHMAMLALVMGRASGLTSLSESDFHQIRSDEDLSKARAKKYFKEAIEARNTGDLHTASSLLKKATELDTGYFNAYLQRSAILYDIGETTEGLVCARHAAGLQADSERAHYMISQHLARQGLLDEAKTAAKIALELEPEMEDVITHLSWIESNRQL